jgi:hypothetical protein
VAQRGGRVARSVTNAVRSPSAAPEPMRPLKTPVSRRRRHAVRGAVAGVAVAVAVVVPLAWAGVVERSPSSSPSLPSLAALSTATRAAALLVNSTPDGPWALELAQGWDPLQADSAPLSTS